MLEIFIEKYDSVGKILLFTIIFVFIFIFLSQRIVKQYVNDNWQTIRKNPLMMMFSGFFKREKGETILSATINNFFLVIWNIVSSVTETLFKPLYGVVGILVNMFKQIGLVLENIRKQVGLMRGFMLKILESMFLKVQESTAIVMYFFLKLREGMKRSLGIFSLLINTMDHTYIFFESLLGSPFGDFLKDAENTGVKTAVFTFGVMGIPTWQGALCFGPNTQLEDNFGNMLALKDTEVGMELKNNNKILGKLYVYSKYKDLYKYNNVYVTGNHLVFDKTWKRIKDCSDSVKINDNSIDKLICLVTSKGIIDIENVLYRDYLDTHNKKINKKIRSYVNDIWNTNSIKNENECEDLLFGFSKEIQILNKQDIIGEIEIEKNILDVYEINNLKLSGNVLVKVDGIFRRAYTVGNYVGKNKEKFIHYITKNKYIEFENMIILDFTEGTSQKHDSNIDDIIDNYYNDYSIEI